MTILFSVLLLVGAADDSADMLNPFLQAVEGTAIDEFAVQPVMHDSAQADNSSSQVAEIPACEGEPEIVFECGSVHDWDSLRFASVKTVRPDWIDQPLDKSGAVHLMSVSSPPKLTEIEARDALDEAILKSVREYVDDQIGRVGAGRHVHITMNDVYDYRVTNFSDRYLDTRDLSVGPMKVAHARLTLSPQFRAEMSERWKEHLVTSRLMRTGLTVAGAMLLLIIVFGLLKSASK